MNSAGAGIPSLYPRIDYEAREKAQVDFMSPGEEAQEIAADTFFLGGVALASEIHAAKLRGLAYDIDVPVIEVEDGTALNEDAASAVQQLKEELQRYQRDPVHTQVMDTEAGLRLRTFLKNIQASGTLESIMNLSTDLTDERGKKLPQFILTAKEQMAKRLSKKDPYTWKQWLNDITTTEGLGADEIRIRNGMAVNFAQWYYAQVKPLASVEGRQAYADSLKELYLRHVDRAMEGGTKAWIDPKYKKRMHEAAAKARIRTWSAFGDRGWLGFAEGVTQIRPGRPLDAYFSRPTPEMVSDHELNHVDMEIDFNDIYKYLWVGLHNIYSQLTSDQKEFNDEWLQALYWLHTALNEGFNDHCTIAYLYGHPEIIDPDVRSGKNLPDKLHMSAAYRPYHKLFAAIITGATETLTHEHLRGFITSVMDADPLPVAEYIAQRWQGTDVLTGLLPIIKDWLTERGKPENQNNPAFGDKALVAKLVAHLKETREKLEKKSVL